MIYYDIQHHGDFQYVPWLVSLLDDEGNKFCINCDTSETLFASVKSEIEKSTADITGEIVNITQSQPVTWCGPSQVEIIFASLRHALEHKHWQWFINMSGTCAPIKSQSEIRRHLEKGWSEGISAHFNWFKPVKPVFDVAASGTSEPIFRTTGRINFLGVPELLDLFPDRDFNPILNPQNRVYLKCREHSANDNKVLEVGWLDPAERRFREEFFRKNPHYCGRSWFILHRSAVEEIIGFWDSQASDGLKRIFLNCFEPDESIIPTIVLNRFAIGKERVSKGKFRSYYGGARLLNDSSYEELLRTEWDSLFIRKIIHSGAERLRRVVEDSVTGSGP